MVPGVRTYFSPRVAPDGSRLAVGVTDNGKSDVWIFDPQLSTFSKLTDVGTVTSVEWNAGGSRVLYAATGQGQTGGVWSQPASGGSAAEQLFGEPYVTPAAAPSPDGRSLAVVSVTTSIDVVRVALDSERVARPYAATPANEEFPRFSPDGRWVALTSDESGRNEVYVRSYPDPSARIQVSVAGGAEPVWSPDGTRIVFTSYRGTAGDLYSRLASGAGDDQPFLQSNTWKAATDWSRDGKRILAISPQSNDFQLVVSPNWITELRRRVAESRQ